MICLYVIASIINVHFHFGSTNLMNVCALEPYCRIE